MSRPGITVSGGYAAHVAGPPTDDFLPSRGTRAMSWFPRQAILYLFYLANLLWQPVFNLDRTWVDWAVVIGVVVLFLPLFVIAYHPRPDLSRFALVATIVLATAASMVNIGAAVLFVYAAAMAAGDADDGPDAWRWLVGLSLLMGLIAIVSPVEYPYRVWALAPSFVFSWIIGLQVRGEVERDREAQRLRIDNVRVEQLATSAERERIAMDLHDLLGQSLTSLVVRAQLVQSLAPVDPVAAAREAGQLEQTARDTLDQVRAAVGGLHEMRLDEELVTARLTLDAAGVAFTADVPAALRLTPMVERSLSLALREAVTNVVRHADARTCTVRVAPGRAGGWALRVEDDGVGPAGPEGNGLRGMRERIAALGGAVERRAGARGTGTALVVTVPA